MHERKIEMYNNADAFLIFPGGIGTLEEFFEIYSWKQLRLHKKPIFIYNFNDFWRDLFTLLENIINFFRAFFLHDSVSLSEPPNHLTFFQ